MAAVSTIIAGAGLAVAAGGAVASADSQRKALHAQQDAQKAATDPATNGSVDINALDQQARDFAKKNAADSAALEQQYNPGAAQLRSGSLAALNAAGTGPSAATSDIAARIAAQAGATPTGISYDSPLLRDAIAKAKGDLALGGTLDTETQNAATRHALATSGRVSGGLGLGRDLTARDLGLTSLQLENQRLQNAASIGQQEAGLGQGNAQLSLQAQIAGQNNLFNSGNFLSSIDSGDFARKLALAQFGQNIAQPLSGLDPGSVVNLAVGNSKANAQGLQQASALQASGANNSTQNTLGLVGTGLGIAQKYFNSPSSTPSTTSNNLYNVPSYNYGMGTTDIPSFSGG